jgi:mono/diheme cytochrome c family protein
MTIATHVRIVFFGAVALTAAACHHGSTPVGANASKTAAMPAKPALPAGVTLAMITTGDSIFNVAACQRCHGQKAVGGAGGPTLVRTVWYHGSGSYEDIVKTINTGVPKAEVHDPKFLTNPQANGMGAQATRFKPEQIAALASYVWSLNHAH